MTKNDEKNNNKTEPENEEIESKKGRKPGSTFFDEEIENLLVSIWNKKYPRLKITDPKFKKSIQKDLIKALLYEEAERLGVIKPEQDNFIVDYLTISGDIKILNENLTFYMRSLNEIALNKNKKPEPVLISGDDSVYDQVDPGSIEEVRPEHLTTTPEMINSFPELEGEDSKVNLPGGETGTFKPISEIIKQKVAENNAKAKEFVEEDAFNSIDSDLPD